jgi:hypothetical protein
MQAFCAIKAVLLGATIKRNPVGFVHWMEVTESLEDLSVQSVSF